MAQDPFEQSVRNATEPVPESRPVAGSVAGGQVGSAEEPVAGEQMQSSQAQLPQTQLPASVLGTTWFHAAAEAQRQTEGLGEAKNQDNIDVQGPTQPIGVNPQPVAPPPNLAAPQISQPQPVAQPVRDADELLAEMDGISVEELQQLRASEVAFQWHASEYVHHHKGVAWYAGMIGGMLVLAGIAAMLQYWTTLVAFLVMGAAIVVYALKPPRTLLYELTPDGLTIDGRHFPFTELRSFGVVPDVDWHTIDFEPVKRFSPRITVLFEDQDFEEIVGHLELHLPRVDRKPDLIEQITRYLRF